MPGMLEKMKRIASHEAPPPPIAETLGFAMTSVEFGVAIYEMQTTSRHANPMGTLHGGVLCDLADAAMGTAYFTTLEDGDSFTTLELKINFLKPIWNSKLTATGKVVKGGKTVGLVECDVVDEKGSLVAHATSTCLTLRGDQAKGR